MGGRVVAVEAVEGLPPAPGVGGIEGALRGVEGSLRVPAQAESPMGGLGRAVLAAHAARPAARGLVRPHPPQQRGPRSPHLLLRFWLHLITCFSDTNQNALNTGMTTNAVRGPVVNLNRYASDTALRAMDRPPLTPPAMAALLQPSTSAALTHASFRSFCAARSAARTVDEYDIPRGPRAWQSRRHAVGLLSPPSYSRSTAASKPEAATALRLRSDVRCCRLWRGVGYAPCACWLRCCIESRFVALHRSQSADSLVRGAPGLTAIEDKEGERGNERGCLGLKTSCSKWFPPWSGLGEASVEWAVGRRRSALRLVATAPESIKAKPPPRDKSNPCLAFQETALASEAPWRGQDERPGAH